MTRYIRVFMWCLGEDAFEIGVALSIYLHYKFIGVGKDSFRLR